MIWSWMTHSPPTWSSGTGARHLGHQESRKPGAQRGIACLPMSLSAGSEAFFWGFYILLMLIIPLLLIARSLYCIYRDLGRKVLDSVKFSQTQGNRASIGKTKESLRVLVTFFVRLFVVFLVFWIPTALFIWLVITEDATVPWLGGLISHLQGMVSASLHLNKRDIKGEQLLLFNRHSGTRQITQVLCGCSLS